VLVFILVSGHAVATGRGSAFSRSFLRKEFLMVAVSFLSLLLSAPAQAPQVNWLKDYDKATELAVKEKKDLVIVFQKAGELNDVLANKNIAKQLHKRFVCLRLPADYKYDGKRLLDAPALSDMMGKPGLARTS
jgi:predicted protein tyrosine phosphatase